MRMSNRQAFCAAYPDVHPAVREYFPDFDYRQCVGDRNIICRMDSGPDNKVGHQQRAHSCFWALEHGGPLDLGLDLGSPRGMTPYAIHVDIFGDGRVHPIYGGGPYLSDIVYDASQITKIVPAVPSCPFIISNHSLEHMPGGDREIADLLVWWLSRVRPGGVLAMIIPDNAWFDVLKSDPDHKNAWSHDDFKPRVLDEVLRRSGSPTELVAYDTLDNHFSFDCVLRAR